MSMRRHLPLVLAVCLWFASAGALAAPSDEECMVCHGDPSATRTLENGKVVSLYVDAEVYARSKHADAGCVSCHNDIDEVPHQPKLNAVDCSVCHAESEEYAQSLHGRALASGDKDLGGCMDCHGKHDILGSDDPLSPTNKHNQPQTCGKCHSDAGLVERHMVSVQHPSQAYLQSTHAKEIQAGKMEAAVCSDCHGAHNMLPAHMPGSPVYHLNIADTCGKCHAKETEEFEKSIHGEALVAGIPDAPTCTDCHGEHDIEGPGRENSAVSAKTVSKSTCPRCHEDVQVMTKYGVETMRQASYMDSYHGMASAAGSLAVASCTSCHGTHHILPQSDPASMISIANLPETCGQCHENAGPNFAAGPVHIIPTDPGQKALGIVRIVYLWIIGLTLGGMIIHNTLLLFRFMLHKFIVEWRGRRTHRRFTRSQVIGHFILSVSFTALAVSGFALRYPEQWWSRLLFFGQTGLEVRGDVHRISGVIFIALTLVYLFHAIFTLSGRKELHATVLTWKDAKDIMLNLAYSVGLTRHRPRYDRYSYSEKLEYWGLWWGTLIMIVTGLCMWYANIFLAYLPKFLLDIAALIHWYEAWLAIGTIIIWHIYFMVFDPDSYPMNMSWLSGKITEDALKHHHPLEYERIKKEQEAAAAAKGVPVLGCEEETAVERE